MTAVDVKPAPPQLETMSMDTTANLRLPLLQMEVGIEDCLHIEFEYSKGKYHLSDTVVGKIYFLLVRIRLKHMEIEIRRRETTGAPHPVALGFVFLSARFSPQCPPGCK
jgi:Vacuolar protein sorting-associated protein 26